MIGIVLVLIVTTSIYLIALFGGSFLFHKSPIKQKIIYLSSIFLAALIPVAACAVLLLANTNSPGIHSKLAQLKGLFIADEPEPRSLITPESFETPRVQSFSTEPQSDVDPIATAIVPLVPPIVPPPEGDAEKGFLVPIAEKPVDHFSNDSSWGSKILLVCFWFWASGIVLVWGRILGGWYLSKRHLRQCTEIPGKPKFRSLMKITAEEVGLSSTPKVVCSPEEVAPSVVCPIRPTVVLAQSALERLSKEELQFVLRHEFGHIQRNDLVLNLLARTCIAFHWFNPLAHRVLNRLRLCQEELCDNEAISSGDRFEYARLLVKANQLFPLKISQCALAMTYRSTMIDRRIGWVLDEARDRRRRVNPVWHSLVFATVLSFGLVFGTIAAALQASVEPPQVVTLTPVEPVDDLDDGIYYVGTGLEKGQSGVIRVDESAHMSEQCFKKFPGSIDQYVKLPNGKFAVAARAQGQRQIWVIDSKGEGEPIGPNHGRNWIRKINCSPDGDFLACYVEGRTVGVFELYLYDLVGGNCREISPMNSIEAFEMLSKDALAFRTFSWSPDSGRLAIESVVRIEHHRYVDMIGLTRTSAIDLYDPEANRMTRLVKPTKDLEYPSWSPTGEQIAFRVGRQLYVATVGDEETEPKLLMDGLERMNLAPKWSPDGSSIMVNRPAIKDDPTRSQNELVIINASSGATKTIPFRRQIWDYAWGPDSEHFAATAGGLLFLGTTDGVVNETNCVVGHWSTVQWNFEPASDTKPSK